MCPGNILGFEYTYGRQNGPFPKKRKKHAILGHFVRVEKNCQTQIALSQYVPPHTIAQSKGFLNPPGGLLNLQVNYHGRPFAPIKSSFNAR